MTDNQNIRSKVQLLPVLFVMVAICLYRNGPCNGEALLVCVILTPLSGSLFFWVFHRVLLILPLKRPGTSERVIRICQGCGSDPGSGHIWESTNECIKLNGKTNWCFSHSPYLFLLLSKINKHIYFKNTMSHAHFSLSNIKTDKSDVPSVFQVMRF